MMLQILITLTRDMNAAAVSVDFPFTISSCDLKVLEGGGNCTRFIPTMHTMHSSVDVPFVYNYTCSPSILRAYVPLYQQMFLLLIVSMKYRIINRASNGARTPKVNKTAIPPK